MAALNRLACRGRARAVIGLCAVLGCSSHPSAGSERGNERGNERGDSGSRAVELWIGGDAHLGFRGGAQRLEAIAARFPGAAGVVNLEGPLGGTAEDFRSSGRLANAPAAIEELWRGGVRAVGIANNHADDLGPEGALATQLALARAGLAVAAAREPAVLILGETPPMPPVRVAISAHDLTHGVPATLAEDLARARRAGDVLIASFHVTAPALYLPEPELRRAAELALQAGASIVAAHGTHALGPIERRGSAVIAWGLGNLVFDCDCTDERDALVLRARIEDRRVSRVEIVPIEAGLEGEAARPSSDPDAIFDLLRALGSTPLDQGVISL